MCLASMTLAAVGASTLRMIRRVQAGSDASRRTHDAAAVPPRPATIHQAAHGGTNPRRAPVAVVMEAWIHGVSSARWTT